MRSTYPSVSLLLASFSILFHTTQSSYVLVDDYSGASFFQSFEFFTGADPTNGHVKFKSMAEANATGLVGLLEGGNAQNAVYMGVDTTSEAPEGRGSVRVSSKKTYQHALVIADIVHMPGGCGTWPAFWMLGDNWPNNGEIDIVEGVNDQTSNQMTLYTNTGARLASASTTNLQNHYKNGDTSTSPPQQAPFTGQVLTSNCDVNAPDQSKNAGCAILADPPTRASNNNTNATTAGSLTFGTNFNANGGGVYATEWTSEHIKIWFFPRGSFPPDLSASLSSSSPSSSNSSSTSISPTPNEATWGAPTSLFTGPFKMDDHFKDLRLVLDTSFCGDWAGNTWSQSSCASLAPTCEEYVSKNPAAFTQAYWALNSLRVWQDDGTGTGIESGSGSGQTQGNLVGTGAGNGNGDGNEPAATVGPGTTTATTPGSRGKWVQSGGGPTGWAPRKRAAGAVLPPRA